jgi:uncharacterized protein (DUF305 family)
VRITHALAAITIGVGLTVTGCGSNDDDGGGGDQDQFNDVDVTFAQDMILHHQQAVMMSIVATDQASDPAVVRLAGEIQRAQEPEIDTMHGWLNEWDAEMSHSMEGMGHDMPGFMSEHDMSRLTSVSGRAFDQLFLTMMIEHHEGAIEMAQTEQAGGANPEAIALADDIEAAQSREIDQMREMLGQR